MDTEIIVNLRDVGEFVNYLSGKKIMHEKRLFRGGRIGSLDLLSQSVNPQTVINLRSSPDPIEKSESIKQFHFPIANSLEKYNTQLPDVRKWLNTVLSVLSSDDIKYPVYLHCTSGKDRTGIVIASLLWLLGIPENIIKEEYLLSEGKVSIHQIKLSLEGLKRKSNYFSKVSLSQLKSNFLVSL
ncbi:MAG: tyrosine-protein phosphatase [Clostridia bacterium]|nr:tyrosine-protein phosphatase [Clostridia bacterium]